MHNRKNNHAELNKIVIEDNIGYVGPNIDIVFTYLFFKIQSEILDLKKGKKIRIK